MFDALFCRFIHGSDRFSVAFTYSSRLSGIKRLMIFVLVDFFEQSLL
nr:MAG TPA: hypothetical protein [Caudoviricetes sp.]